MAGLGQGILQGQQTVQNNQLNQIDMEIKKLQLETMRSQQALQQATAARQQGADAAAAGVLQQYYGAKQQAPQAPPAVNMPPPPVQSPQTPQAGQASQPMMQPGQQPPPIPPQGPQGGMPPPGTPPLPPGQPGGQPAPPPYKRIETQKQEAAAQPPAAPPQQPQQPIPQQAPAEDSLTFDSAVQILQQKGIQGPAMVDALDRLKPYLDDAAKRRTEALTAQIKIQQSMLNVAKFSQQGDHYAALEANANARLALEQQRVAIEAQAKAQAETDRQQAAADRKQAKEDAKIPSGFERGPDGNLRPMKGGPADPTSQSYKGVKPGQTVADKMNPTMLATVRNDITEVGIALDAIKHLNADTTGPYYAADHASQFSKIVGRAVTPEQQQKYEVAVNRLAVAIATMQSMGRGQLSDTKVAEARALIPQLGDKPGTRQYKLDYIKKLSDNAQKVLNSPLRGSPNEPDQDREAATAGSVPGGGNPKTVDFGDLK